MDEEKKKQVAIFRFGVISDFVRPARLEWGARESGCCGSLAHAADLGRAMIFAVQRRSVRINYSP